MFTRVLIANRGEVAIRIDSTLKRLGINSVGIYTAGDEHSRHVRQMSETVLLQDGTQTGYLDGAQIITAAIACGAEAIHPGYGFLAENAQFASDCEEAGLIFIGPPPAAIAAMGEKVSAREYAIRSGVPVVPGISLPNMTDSDLLAASHDLEFPLLVKPSAGGGGKGLHVVRNLDELKNALPMARREAKASFADDGLFIEKYLPSVRHIEFQIAGDNYGRTLHLGERDCSLQRRHQKVVEEAPSTLMSTNQRELIGAAALELAATINYRNLGTIEFLVDTASPNDFYFMEMNTRLQVEHRVTELITGLDLVECQLRLAAGEALADVIPSVHFTGHAVEARIYAEDAYRGFLPTGGLIETLTESAATDTVTDSAVVNGEFVSSAFDPMLAKVACWGQTRQIALSRLRQALKETVLFGVTSNIDYLTQLLNSPDVQTSSYDTTCLETFEIIRPQPPALILDAYAALVASGAGITPWTSDAWRLAGLPAGKVVGYVDGKRYEIALPANSEFEVTHHQDDDNFWIHHLEFGTWLIKGTDERRSITDGLSDQITSPMPGIVIAVEISVGETVAVGDPLVIIEAMKMEHIVRARSAGRIGKCHVSLGSSVRSGQLLIEVIENV
ncbi:MAG TPA: biotin carboxylase N-terminal domain-containing protein [Candidatus Nanopelagicaceae bacterium]|nr:biotin carboxylase N-terminal domain-containing protein [Candidatus Nanopelagicaceae bacterium]